MPPWSGDKIAEHRSIEIAIKVLMEADTDTPWKYETDLQKKIPKK
jgi:hypothetical protein